MALDTLGILKALESHALRLGKLERVNRHEPKNSPGRGVTAAIWVQQVTPASAASGLAATSAVVTANVRLYANMLAEPQDAIDPNLVAAADALMNAYSGDFDLGGKVRNVDLLGQFGEGLAARAGYLEQDRKMFRVITITVPMVVNDVWAQQS